MLWRVRGIPICCTIRSETNEADDALSNSALASIDDPSGEVTNTRQVIRRVLDVNLTAALEETDCLEASLEGVADVSEKVNDGKWHHCASRLVCSIYHRHEDPAPKSMGIESWLGRART